MKISRFAGELMKISQLMEFSRLDRELIEISHLVEINENLQFRGNQSKFYI